MEIEAKLVHRGHQGPDHPARIGALRRKAHEGNNLRNRQQSCPYAVPTLICVGRYSEGCDSCHGADRKLCVIVPVHRMRNRCEWPTFDPEYLPDHLNGGWWPTKRQLAA